MKSEMKLIAVPLDALERHAENVRKAPTDEEADASLAASIRAYGLLSPLIVEGSEERARVIGGGRRLAALSAIAADGGLPQDHPVPCVLVGGSGELGLGAVIELSLAENSGRQRMNPADEAAALAALRARGATDRQLADRFGLSPRTVQRRLRIARAAPELLRRCRDGKLQLGVIEAALLEPDHARQVRAVDSVSAMHQQFRADEIRHIIIGDRESADGPIGRFVGLDAYEAAGGTVMRDHQYGNAWLNRRLAHRLALDKLGEAAHACRERGWPDVRFGLEEPSDAWRRNPRIADHGEGPPKGFEGVLHLSVGYDGGMKCQAIAFRPKTDDAPKAPGLSAALRSDLLEMRGGIERARLAEAPPDLARDLMIFALLGTPADSGLGFRADAQAAASSSVERGVPTCVLRAEGRARDLFEDLTAWTREESAQERWSMLRCMSEDARRRLLACCTARLLMPVDGPRRWRPALAELDIDWAAEWRPDASVLGRMTKAQLIAAVGRVIGAQDPEIDRLRALPKGELVERAGELLGDGGWLPPEVFGEDADG